MRVCNWQALWGRAGENGFWNGAARGDATREVLAEGGRPSDSVLNLVVREFNNLRKERGPSDADARDGSGEGENDDRRRAENRYYFDHRVLRLYDSNILYLNSSRERCAISSLGKEGTGNTDRLCPVSSWLHLRTFSTSLMLTKTGLSSVLLAR